MRPDVVRGNVFVANLPLGFTDEQLAELFDPYGMVLRAYLARDPATGAPTGHGLVELAPERVVDAAIEAVSAERPGGRRVDVRRADSTMGITVKRANRPARPDATWSTPRPPRAEAVVVEYERDSWRSAGRTPLRLSPKR